MTNDSGRDPAFAAAPSSQSSLSRPSGLQSGVGRPSKGERAYIADVEARPFYHDGKPRRSWNQLSDIARWSWEKNPYPLPCAPENAGSN